MKILQDISFTLLASCGTQYVTAADYKINVNVMQNVWCMTICHELIARR